MRRTFGYRGGYRLHAMVDTYNKNRGKTHVLDVKLRDELFQLLLFH